MDRPMIPDEMLQLARDIKNLPLEYCIGIWEIIQE
jgi:hypothetical protein